MRLTFDLQPGDDRLFTDESLEQIGQIEQGLLELEQDLDPRVVNEVFRAAHTLKGSAATIGHRRLAELTHAMEDLFGAFRSGMLTDVAPFADVLLATIDVLRALVAEVREGSHSHRRTGSPDTPAARAALYGHWQPPRSRGTADFADAAAVAAATAAPASASATSDDCNDRLGGDGGPESAVAPLIQRLLWEAPGGYEPRSLIVCRIDPMSEWQSVRLLQLVIEGQETGALIASAPDRQEIESGLGSSLVAMLVRGRPIELFDLRKRLAAIDDVVGVEVANAPVAGEAPDPARDARSRRRRVSSR